MPISPTSSFSDADRRLAQRLQALAHPARLEIVRLLAERDECVCGEIVDDLPLAQSTVSQHLKALKGAGLVRGTVDGRRTCYCLDPEALLTLENEVSALFDGLSLSFTADQCC